MRTMFLYPPNGYLNHSMFKHYTYFAETIQLLEKDCPNPVVMDCAVEMRSRNEIYNAFEECGVLAILIEPYNIQMALSLATIYKDIHPGGKTVLFGTAAVLIPNYLSRQRAVDHVIANGNFSEGILKVVQSAENTSGSLPVILSPFVSQSEHRWGVSLDAPVPLEQYRHFGNSMFEFTVQVGCPFNCSFCSEKVLFPFQKGFQLAQRPPEDTVTLLKRVKGNFDSVYFSATTLTYDRAWITDICNRMVQEDCILPWRSDTRVDCLDPQLLSVMKKSGLTQLSLGVESFEDHLLSSVNKHQTADTVYEKICMCKELGINIKALLILGLPGQTSEDILHTQMIVEELKIPYRWKEYSQIRELHSADCSGADIGPYIKEFDRTSFRANSIPGLSSAQYMALLFPHNYIR